MTPASHRLGGRAACRHPSIFSSFSPRSPEVSFFCMSARYRALGSLLPLIALLSGGLGLPLFDAAFFHAARLAARSERIMTEPGTPPGHSQFCLLDQAGPLSRGLPAPGEPAHLTPPDPTDRPTCHHSAPSSHVRFTAELPRAPPAA